MPKGLASIDAAKALLDYVQDNVPKESPVYPHVGLGTFEHSGMKMRGLSAKKHFEANDTIISLPAEYGVTMKDVKGHRFEGAPSSKTAMALWLAERRIELQNPEASHAEGSHSDVRDFWARAIENYPKLSHFASVGLPLAAPDKDLKALDALPILSNIPAWVRQTRGQLAQALAWYNENRENHPQLKWEDVLWGRIILSAYSFGTDSDGSCGTHLSPVADLVDHDMNNNAHFDCNDSKHNIEIVADRPIEPGEELTIMYKTHPYSNFQFYGILDQPAGHVATYPFNAHTCSELKNAHLDLLRTPLAANTKRFIDLQCPQPGSGNVAASPDVELSQSSQVLHSATNSGSSSWPDQDAEMEKMAESHGAKMAEKELASMPMAEVAKLVAEAQKTPTSSLEASGLPFSESEVTTATMPPMFMLPLTLARSRRTDTAAFLQCPNLGNLVCQKVSMPKQVAKKGSSRQNESKVRRNCFGRFQWDASAQLIFGH